MSRPSTAIHVSSFVATVAVIAVAAFLVFPKPLEVISNTFTRPFVKKENTETTNYEKRAELILRNTPLIDGHNDFPFLLRQQLRNKIYDHNFRDERLSCHSDFQKMRDGLMGGQFWSVFVPCPEDLVPGVDIDNPKKRIPELNEPNWAVRDTLEQIDITKRLINYYPDYLELCITPAEARRAFGRGKIASMIGIEGGHQTGDSLGALRQLFDMGARYMTMTHNCDNSFATCHMSWNQETGEDAGLTEFGKYAIWEMNRLGMMVDLSHVSPKTMRQVLEVTKAPVIFSHSGAYDVNKHSRNVPDDVIAGLKMNGGIVMVPAISPFMNSEHPEDATIEDVVDHILHVVHVAGWEHVGLGSDFDGSTMVVKGLEDTSRWPNLIERLLARGGISDNQAKLLVGENLLRVWENVEQVALKAQERSQLPYEETWEGRLWETADFDVPKVLAST